MVATHASGLERFAEPALRLLLTRLAPLGNERANEVLLLPLAKMQRVWGKVIRVAAARRLEPLEAALGDCDFVPSQERTRPVGPILNLRLSKPFNRFTPVQFVGWFRWQFRIPSRVLATPTRLAWSSVSDAAASAMFTSTETTPARVAWPRSLPAEAATVASSTW